MTSKQKTSTRTKRQRSQRKRQTLTNTSSIYRTSNYIRTHKSWKWWTIPIIMISTQTHTLIHPINNSKHYNSIHQNHTLTRKSPIQNLNKITRNTTRNYRKNQILQKTQLNSTPHHTHLHQQQKHQTLHTTNQIQNPNILNP